MCLENIEGGLQIATEDIVVYKALKRGFIVDRTKVSHGDEFKAIMKNGLEHTYELTGKISINFNNKIFLCHDDDNVRFHGQIAEDKLGYEYSWLFDDYVKELYVKDENILNESMLTPFQDFPIEIGEIYTSELEVINDRIEKGLHSFPNKKSLSEVSEKLHVECVIPKGSEYYIGEWEGTRNKVESIASNCLKYVKIIKK